MPDAPAEGAAPAPQEGGTNTPPPSVDLLDGVQLPSDPAPVENPPEGGENPPEGETKAPEPARVYGGRFDSIEGLETAYDESGREARRLYEAGKTSDAKIRELEGLVEDAKNSKNSGFNLLSTEEENRLKEDDIGGYTTYRLAKDAHERDQKSTTEKREQAEKEADDKFEQTSQAIRTKTLSMRVDAKNYPDYNQLQPVMDQLLTLMPNIAGEKYSPVLLYYAAKGFQTVKTQLAGSQQTEESRKAAADTAALAANGGQLPGDGGKTPSADVDPINAEMMKGYVKNALPNF